METPAFSGTIPRLTTAQMIEVDRLMIEKYKIDLVQMMENAGRNLARLAQELYLPHPQTNQPIVVLAGTGGNGGGTLVSARRLLSWGYKVQICLANESRMAPVPKHQLDILKNMRADISTGDSYMRQGEAALVIDGLIGYSLKGAPRGDIKAMIEWANYQNAPLISLDTPSGIDLSTGKIQDPAIRAVATMTLAMPKIGLFNPEVIPHRGDLYLADIGVPTELYSEDSLNLPVKPIFSTAEILRLA